MIERDFQEHLRAKLSRHARGLFRFLKCFVRRANRPRFAVGGPDVAGPIARHKIQKEGGYSLALPFLGIGCNLLWTDGKQDRLGQRKIRQRAVGDGRRGFSRFEIYGDLCLRDADKNQSNQAREREFHDRVVPDLLRGCKVGSVGASEPSERWSVGASERRSIGT